MLDCNHLYGSHNVAMYNVHFRYYCHMTDCTNESVALHDADRPLIVAAHDGNVVDLVDNKIRSVNVVKLAPNDKQ